MKQANTTPAQTPELLPAHREPLSPEPADALIGGNDEGRILAIIEKAGTDPNFDVAKMERMLGLYKDMVHMKEMREFNAAMLAVQSEAPAIAKDKLNPSTNSKFATLDKIQDALNPILLKNQLVVSFGTDHSSLPNHYGVTCIVSRNGYERAYRCDVPCDDVGMKGNPTKTKTHGFGSALSYGERYLMKLIFNLRLIGEDDDGNKGQRPKPQGPQATEPENEVKQLMVELWSLLKPVRGTKHDWEAAHDWLFKNEILDPAVDPPQRVSKLDAPTLRAVISKVKQKLASGDQ